MTIEQKAKAYDESIERAKAMIKVAANQDEAIGFANTIFPELKKESDDEKIRKFLIKWIQDNYYHGTTEIPTKTLIAWLEKQGEQKPSLRERYDKIKDSEWFKKTHEGMSISDDENIDGDMKETEHTIKPKFKVGDWIISNNKKSTYQVIEVKRGIYVIRDNVDNHEYHIGIEECEKSGRLFTIQDVKDSDILTYNNGAVEIILLFKEWKNGYIGAAHTYAYVFNNNININNWCDCGENAHPATKEQRDLLFQKMKEEGYEWNSETKELKKIKQKSVDKIEPKFKEGDWIVFNERTLYIRQVIKGFYRTISKSGLTNIYNWDIDNVARLWTIQDAKDGDVLSGIIDDAILMFRGIGNTEWDDVIDYYCYYDCHREDFIVQENVEYWGNTENCQLKPATKEQRNLLFQKMKEAGYEWNPETKNLNNCHRINNNNEMIAACIGMCLTDANEQRFKDYNTNLKECLAWLKTQGEHKKFRDSIQVSDEVTRNSDGVIVNLSQLKRVAKPAQQKLPIEKLSEEMKTIGESLGFTTQEECDEYNQIVSDLIMSDDNKEEQKPNMENKKLTDVNHEYFSELLENNNSKDINDYAYQVAYCMSHDWLKDNATWEDIQQACKLGAEWKEKQYNNLTNWSKEDEQIKENIIYDLNILLEDSKSEFAIKDLKKEINWIESLKPQNHWKPSKEQIEALYEETQKSDRIKDDRIVSLYNDLKKLKGE